LTSPESSAAFPSATVWLHVFWSIPPPGWAAVICGNSPRRALIGVGWAALVLRSSAHVLRLPMERCSRRTMPTSGRRSLLPDGEAVRGNAGAGVVILTGHFYHRR